VTSYDVARLAGVSQSAVSRAFQLGTSIAPATRAKVEAAARALGYAPNAIARSLITRRSGLLAVLVPDLTLRNYPGLLYHLDQELQARDRQMLLVTLDAEDAVARQLPRLFQYQVEGVLSCVTMGTAEVEACRAHGVAVLLYNRELPGGFASAVCCDHVEGMRRLASLAHEAGYRRCGFVAGPPGAPVSEARRRGLVDRLAELGHRPVPVVHADYSYEGGTAATRALLAAEPAIDLVACANDAMALGALDLCRFELGRAVPDEIGVTGFDDIPETARPAYALTTVRQRVRAMTRDAVAMLVARIDDPSLAPEKRLVPALVTLRATLRRPAARAPATAAA
jgi:DNA-binding LacI/PurR family transcriptional regulator